MNYIAGSAPIDTTTAFETFSGTQVYPATSLNGFPVYAYGISIQSQSSSSTPSLSPSAGLSTGDKAGIGIAVGLFCVGFVVGLVLFWHWRRRRRSRQQADRSVRENLPMGQAHGLFPKAELEGKLSSAALHSSGRADGRSFSSSDAFGAKGAVADRLDVTPQPSFNVRPLTARWRFEIHDPTRASCVLQPPSAAFSRRLADGSTGLVHTRGQSVLALLLINNSCMN